MILVVGCGFLGSYISKYALKKTKEPVVATVRSLSALPDIEGVNFVQCDVTCKKDVESLYEQTRNEELTVFYLAACHNVDFVYENPDEAKKTNCDALEQFLSVMKNIKKLFFASTDCVYGENGKMPRLSEASPLVPVNEYGRQKIEAEKIVLSKGFNVTRLPFMMGPSLTNKPHFYDNICVKLKKGESVEMIDGMKRSVLSFSAVAEILLDLSKKSSLPQIVNVCGDIALSKYEIGCLIAREIGADEALIEKISEEQGSKFFKDRRASVSVMDNSLLKTLL